MQNEAKFWDKTAKNYAAKPIKDMASYELTMERTRNYLAHGDEVLELGCGSGSTSLLLSEHVKHITATDISGEMVEIGRRKAAEEGKDNVSFAQAEVYDASLDAKAYDVVLAYNLLHLVRDPAAAIRRVHGRIKPGGLFISKTVCLRGWGSPWRVLLPLLQWTGLAPHVEMMSVKELDGMMTRAGFEIIETGIFPASPPARFIVARKI
ncbi:MAG: class I SAM-dependent methyltransferase [Rhodobacteraceae bacterium]|nr:class I SAM-dependent methyltransferase [Paracoccaceae bacterium]